MGTNLSRVAPLALLAGAALVTTTAVSAADARHADRPTLAVDSVLRDLQTATTSPFDGARSRVRMTVGDDETVVRLRLSGVARVARGTEYGAHLHVGRCVTGDGAAAGPHYNVDVLAGAPSPEVSDRTEVWLDLEVRSDGTARARARVPFEVQPGDRAVVIHAEATQPNGTAGPRLACLPVVW